MPFEIIRNDIANVKADAIVNTANPRPVVGAGTDAAIHHKAGPGLLQARREIGDITVGQCAITPAYGLDARYVIHTVGPVWVDGAHGEKQLLESCFRNSLEMAAEYDCSSIAFPLISSGIYGFPRHEALQIAVQTFSHFLMDHDMQIYLVVWDKDAFRLSEKLFDGVRSFIDEHYIEEKRFTYGFFMSGDASPRRRREQENQAICDAMCPQESQFHRSSLPTQSAGVRSKSTSPQPCFLAKKQPCCPLPTAHADTPPSLDELLKNTDAGFTETLLKLIDETGKKDSEIYKRANVSKQHFSKIRNNPDYKPTKATALAFAIALELDLDQTQDLIGRAGYALTNSSKFDVIITYFITIKNYDMFDINMTLFQFDQMTLGV